MVEIGYIQIGHDHRQRRAAPSLGSGSGGPRVVCVRVRRSVGAAQPSSQVISQHRHVAEILPSHVPRTACGGQDRRCEELSRVKAEQAAAREALPQG